MKTWRIEIGRLIDKTGLSRREFCKENKIHHSELSYVINGDRNISVKLAVALEGGEIRAAEYWLGKQMRENIITEELKREAKIRKQIIDKYKESE